MLRPALEALAPIGATGLQHHDGELGADINPLQQAGVPGFAPWVDTRHYFDYHHTAADTLDKVDPQNFRTQVATMAVLAYFLADLPRVPFAFLEAVCRDGDEWECLPAAYVQLSRGYEAEAAQAEARGWTVRRAPLNHLAMLSDPHQVAALLRDLPESLVDA